MLMKLFANIVRVLGALLVLLLLPVFGQAQESEEMSTDPAEELEDLAEAEVEIHGRRPVIETTRLDMEDRSDNVETHAGEAILEIPGVAASRRGAGATEPVIRGLGGERVATQLGPIPIYGACPSSMDPPITYFSTATLDSIEVVQGLSSVRHGSGGTAGRLVLQPRAGGLLVGERRIGGRLVGIFDVARRGFGYRGELHGGGERFAASVSGEILRLGDYESGSEVTVPANLDRYGLSLSLAYEPARAHRFWMTTSWIHESDVDFPALPMNNDETDFGVALVGYRYTHGRSVLRSIEIEGGVALVDHLMSNRSKPNYAMLHATTESDTVSFGGRVEAALRPRSGMELWTGLDVAGVRRDALRERELVASGQLFNDHVWPEVLQWGIGVYAELRTMLTPRLALRTGARGTLYLSSSEGSEDAAIGGLTVSQAWASFWGDAALEPNRTEGAGAAQVLLDWEPIDGLRAFLGTALSMRPSGLTERYFAYGPAPGGYQVGNPTLEGELKWDTSLGAQLALDWLDARLSVFHAWVPTYILRRGVESRDVDGDGTEDLVRSFQNTSAQLVGVELAAVLRAGEHLSFPLTIAWIRGWNTEQGRALPEVPPFEATLAARAETGSTVRLWLELGGRFVAAQEHVDELFPEDETEGFALLRLRSGISYRDRFRFTATVENLLDIEYHEHLTREALMAGGDLLPGDEVPAPGRRVTFSIMADF